MNRSTVNRLLQRTVWVVVILVLLGLIAYQVYWTFRYPALNDYGSFYASGQAVESGKDPYDPSLPFIFELKMVRYRLVAWKPVPEENTIRSVNLNPPISLPFASLAAKTDPWVGMQIWRLLTIFSFVVAVVLLVRAFPKDVKFIWFVWALASAGFWHTIELGQIYAPLLLLTVLALLAFKQNRPVLSGICIGLVVAIKPNFVVWMVVLLFASQLKIFLAGGLTAAILSAIPVFLYGPQVLKSWLVASAQFKGFSIPGNNSLPGLFDRFGYPSIGFLLGGVLVLAILITVWRNKPDGYTVHFLGILASLLFSPIAWTGYTILIIPVLWIKKTSLMSWLTATFFIVPFPIILRVFTLSYSNFILFGWWYGWGLLLLAFWLILPAPFTQESREPELSAGSFKPNSPPTG